MSVTLYGVGHASHPITALCQLLEGAGVRQVLDVRRFPVSRRHPQYNLAPLQSALAGRGIGYSHLPALGGRRSDIAEPVHGNAGIEDAGLRSYADYAQTDAFHRAMDELLERAHALPSAMLCAEGDWRHCHRRIIADHALQAGLAVCHLAVGRAPEAARLDPLAVVAADGVLHYPARQGGLFG
jgi:uncharacterized protein (DUF488 family)